MKHLFATAAGAALLLGGAGAALAEHPTFEINGFPISRHQMIAVSSGLVRESAATPLSLGGMPASPHQLSVLTLRATASRQRIAEEPMQAGVSRVRFLAPSK